MEENRVFDEIKFLKDNYQSPEQWAEDKSKYYNNFGQLIIENQN